MNDPNNVMMRGETLQELTYATRQTNYDTDQFLNELNVALSRADPEDLNQVLYTGLLSTITGKFLQKAGDVGHKVMEHLHRNKTLKQALA